MNQDLFGQAIAAVMPAIRATGLQKSLCTLSLPSGNQTTTGTPDGTYTPIAGLIDIRCTAPPKRLGTPYPDVLRRQDESRTEIPRHVLLDSYYPAAHTAFLNGAIATVDGTDYILANVDHDSQFQMTRLSVTEVHV